MLALVAAVAMFIALFLLVVKPEIGVLAVLIVRPIIDATWDDTLLGDFRLTEIISVAVSLIVLFYLLFRAKTAESINYMPLRNIWLVYVFFIILFSMIILYNDTVRGASGVFFRHFSGFIGFYMIQAFYHDKEKTKVFVIALAIAGIFPLIMGSYSFLTGIDWRVQGSEGLVRHIGLYHDAFTLRYLMLQFLLGLLLYISLLSESRRNIINLFFIGISVFAIIVLFRTYSKSGMVISVSWILMWTIFRKKYLALSIALVFVFIVGIYYLPDLLDTIYQMFHKEIGAANGSIETERTFAGRWYGWYEIIDVWQNLGFVSKLFGSGIIRLDSHNDYLMILMHGGIVTLFTYMILLITTGTILIKNVLKNQSIMNVAGLMALSMWVVDSIGLVPSAYPGYQWFIWGVIGLSLRLAQEEKNIIDKDSNSTLTDNLGSKEIVRFIPSKKIRY